MTTPFEPPKLTPIGGAPARPAASLRSGASAAHFVLSYRGIRNMASIVLATAYFASAWLGRHVKREVLAEHLEALSQRLSKVPEFANYTIADGLKRAFTKFGRWCRKVINPEPDPTPAEKMPYLPGLEAIFLPDVS